MTFLNPEQITDHGGGFNSRPSTFDKGMVSVFYGKTCIASSVHPANVSAVIRRFGDRMSAT